MRYSLVNKSGFSGLTAVGSPGFRAGSGLKLILDLAAQQRLRSILRVILPPSGRTRPESLARSSVRLSHTRSRTF